MGSSGSGREEGGRKLNIFYTNANGFFNKIDELKCFLSCDGKKVDIICVTETHFSKDILDAEVHIDGYTLFRHDRDFKVNESSHDVSHGGGSIIYVRSDINVCKEVALANAPDSLAVMIETSVGKLCIACIYRSNSLNSIQNSNLISCLKSICNVDNFF